MGELFEFESIKQAKSQREIPNDDTINGIPYVVQSVFNNMVARNVNKNWLIENNEPPVSGNRIALGVTLPAVSYQSKEFGASQIITAKAEWLNEKRGLFIAIAISKLMYQFSYGRKPGMQIYREMKIHLPVQNGAIDFAFMENFIAELEERRIQEMEVERIVELEAYLRVTGLSDYILTEEERAVLEAFRSGKISWGGVKLLDKQRIKDIEWKIFRMEDVLEWQPQKEINPLKLDKLQDKNQKLYPFYGQATINNGIISYNQLVEEVLNNKEGKPTILIHSNNQNTIYLESPFYLKDGHGATSVLQSKKLNKLNALYFMSSIKKVILSKYSYNAKATKIELKNTLISLPSVQGKPLYDYMEVFIRAVQKLVIKDVVQYAERKVAATRAVVK